MAGVPFCKLVSLYLFKRVAFSAASLEGLTTWSLAIHPRYLPT